MNLLTINKIKINYSTYMLHLCSKNPKKTYFRVNSFTLSNIMLYLRKKLMTKIKAKKLSLQFVPYLFIVVTILTAFGSNSGTWA